MKLLSLKQSNNKHKHNSAGKLFVVFSQQMFISLV